MAPSSRWEIDEGDWDQVRRAVHEELKRQARRRELISYTELVKRVGHFSGPDSHALAEMLGEINRDERKYKEERLLLSAVVTHKADRYPGKGFFTAASHFGKSVPSRDEEQRIFWARELDLVCEAYGRGGDR